MLSFTGGPIKRRMSAGMLFCVLATMIICLTDVSSAAQRRRTYVPAYASTVKISERTVRGTLKGDFLWAAASSTVRVAALRWKEFLRKHYPPGREVGDGYEAQLITVAQYELMRVYYLLGDAKAGDKLLLKLDPLQLSSGEETPD
jgi:hypothetical protein